MEVMGILKSINRELLNKSYVLLDGRDEVKTELLIVFASDRGFCGNFNYLIGKKVESEIASIRSRGKNIQIICVGRKLMPALKRMVLPDDKLDFIDDFYKDDSVWKNAEILSKEVIGRFSNQQVDKVSIVYTHFYSVVRMDVTVQHLIPVALEDNHDDKFMIFEPTTDEVLENLLLRNISTQIYQSAVESIASEQSSRMSSMDNATRNADDMLADLTIRYNRTRQYGITQELTEVVAGASAIANG